MTEKEATMEPLAEDRMTKQVVMEKAVANAVNHAINVKALFELYSFRIIPGETFIKDMDDLNKEYVNRAIELEKFNV